MVGQAVSDPSWAKAVAQLIDATRINVLSVLHNEADCWCCMSLPSPALRFMNGTKEISAKNLVNYLGSIVFMCRTHSTR